MMLEMLGRGSRILGGLAIVAGIVTVSTETYRSLSYSAQIDVMKTIAEQAPNLNLNYSRYEKKRDNAVLGVSGGACIGCLGLLSAFPLADYLERCSKKRQDKSC